MTAFASKSVATYSNSDVASIVVTEFDFVCWNEDSFPWYSSNNFFRMELPSDPHWPRFESSFGYGIDDELHRAYGFSSLDLP